MAGVQPTMREVSSETGLTNNPHSTNQ